MNSFESVVNTLYNNMVYCFNNPKLPISILYSKVFSILEKPEFIINFKILDENVYNHICFFIQLFSIIQKIKNESDLESTIKYYFVDNVDNPALFGQTPLLSLLAKICTHALFLSIFKIMDNLKNKNGQIIIIDKLSDSEYIENSQFQMSKIINKIRPDIIEYVSKKY